MSESRSNIKSVTYISYSKSNLIQILRNNSKEKEGSHTLLFLKVFIVGCMRTLFHYFFLLIYSYPLQKFYTKTLHFFQNFPLKKLYMTHKERVFSFIQNKVNRGVQNHENYSDIVMTFLLIK